MGIAAITEAEVQAVVTRHKHFQALLAATDQAELDDARPTLARVKWAWTRLGGEGAPPVVRRYDRALTPKHRGFVWRGERTVYVSKGASARTLAHELAHLAQPELSESGIRAFAAEVGAEMELLARSPVRPMVHASPIGDAPPMGEAAPADSHPTSDREDWIDYGCEA